VRLCLLARLDQSPVSSEGIRVDLYQMAMGRYDEMHGVEMYSEDNALVFLRKVEEAGVEADALNRTLW